MDGLLSPGMLVLLVLILIATYLPPAPKRRERITFEPITHPTRAPVPPPLPPKKVTDDLRFAGDLRQRLLDGTIRRGYIAEDGTLRTASGIRIRGTAYELAVARRGIIEAQRYRERAAAAGV